MFIGKVSRVQQIVDDRWETTFTVDEVFRGTPGRTAVVVSHWNGASCDYPQFTTGTRMLIYAGSAADGAPLHVSGCSGTKPLDQAAADLAYLRRAMKTQTATIEGVVRLWDPLQSSESLPRANVEIRVRGTAYATRTGSDGRYRLEVPPGTYTLDIVDDPRLTNRSVTPVELPAVGTWARRDISQAWNGRIRGHIVDHAGLPAANVIVRALRADEREPTRFDGRHFASAQTDASGNFEMQGVPEGEYRVAVSVPFTPKSPIPPVYYPGVPTRAQARTVALTRGGLVTGIDFALRAPLEILTLRGVVMRARKRPEYGNARVRIVNTRDRRHSDALALGDDARFEVEEVKGAVLKVQACDGPLGEGTCTDPVTVTLDKDRSITLTLPE